MVIMMMMDGRWVCEERRGRKITDSNDLLLTCERWRGGGREEGEGESMGCQ